MDLRSVQQAKARLEARRTELKKAERLFMQWQAEWDALSEPARFTNAGKNTAQRLKFWKAEMLGILREIEQDEAALLEGWE